MERYGTIAYRKNDKEFTQAERIRQQKKEPAPDLTFFARLIIRRMQEDEIRKQEEA